MISSKPIASRAVRSALNYAAQSRGKLFYYAYAPHGTRETNIEFIGHPVDIEDVRQSPAMLHIDVEGAQLVKHRSAVRSFYDSDELHRRAYPETAELVRSVTGATEVIVFDHNLRRGGNQPAAGVAGEIKRPVFHIHTDFSARSAPVRAAAALERPLMPGQRFAAINVWRPLAEPLRDCPLALCDASSVDERDLHETDLLYPDRTGQIYYVTFNPGHRWYFASDMRTDEAWLFKNYDSATDGRARFTPHTAFDDPTHPAAAARESIEFRAFAFF